MATDRKNVRLRPKAGINRPFCFDVAHSAHLKIVLDFGEGGSQPGKIP
jgi:hypothetical protein